MNIGAPPFECGDFGRGSEYVVRGMYAGDYEDCNDSLLEI